MTIEYREKAAEADRRPGSAAPAAKPCGDCSLCCKVLKVNAISKPAGRWCSHFGKGSGCRIHAERPTECGAFQCFWSISSTLGEEWRPDRCHFVLWSNYEGRLIVDVDPGAPDAWKKAPYYQQLKTWSDRTRPFHLEILVRSQGRMWVVFPEADVDLGPQQADQSVDSGYVVENGRSIPFARFVPAAPTALQAHAGA